VESPVERSRYQSYLLRFWYEEGGEGRWLFSLEPATGEGRRQGFASLEAVVDFIEERIAEGPQRDERDGLFG
jgi:hypothetical protein